MDLEGIGWADVEAEADAIARADLVKKLVLRMGMS
jgi:hypothetical protein